MRPRILGVAAGFLLVSTRTIQTVSLAGPAGHAFRFVTVFIMAAMLGSYVEFLRDSKPNLLWKDPVAMFSVGEPELSIPLPTSFARPESLVGGDARRHGALSFLGRWGTPIRLALVDAL